MKRLAGLFALLVAVLGAVWFLRRTPRSNDSPLAAAPSVSAPLPAPSEPTPAPSELRPTDGNPQSHKKVKGGELLLRGKWGSAPGEFGRRRDPESNPEAPMAIAAGAGGVELVLDQVNHRVQRFEGGKLVSTISVGGDTVQDLAVAAGGRTVLLDRLADRNVQVYGPDGKLENEVSLVGDKVPEGGAVTGVFADGEGIYVEREHGTLVRIADGSGKSVSDRGELPGRPTRDGRLLIAARLVDAATGRVEVRAFDRTTPSRLAWTAALQLSDGALHLLLLDSDRQGRVYLAADVGHEGAAPPYPIEGERIEVVRITSSGTVDGRIELPAATEPDENFRPITVDDDGAIVLMVDGPDGLEVRRYTF